MFVKAVKKCIAFLLIAIMAFSLMPVTAAAEDNPEEGPGYNLEGKSWDVLIEELCSQYELKDGSFSFGYYNTVTGETHFYDEGRWFIGASIYKLPLGMLYAEMLAGGEIGMSDFVSRIRLETLLYGMIVDSNNAYAEYLWKYRGSYRQMRTDFLRYFDMDGETVDDIYWRNNYFTAEQMLNCLKHLYENSELYAPVIELMLIASPDRNFKSREQKFEIAHKYGYVTEGESYYNDTAICYTDDPICIVMLTRGVSRPSSLLADFCALACDYAQSSREQRLERERLAEEERASEEKRAAEEKAAERAAEEAKAAEEKRLAEEKTAQEKAAREELQRQHESEMKKHRKVLLILAVILIALIPPAVVLSRKKHK